MTKINTNATTTTYRCEVLGVGISPVNQQTALARIDGWIRRREANYVCITGVHGVMESQRRPELKRIHNQAGMVTPDGMPMVWINRLRGNSDVSRVYGPDLMRNTCKAGVERGYRHYLYGGGDGVAETLTAELQKNYPGIEIAGSYTPPFRPLTPAEDADVVKRINDSGSDIVWVGLSTPKQEYWMAEHVGRIEVPVMVGVGAAFDFLAGLKSQAPKIFQKCGMEWFYRMVTEPKRLAKRYLTNNPLFIWNMFLEATGLRDFQQIKGQRVVDFVLEPEQSESVAA